MDGPRNEGRGRVARLRLYNAHALDLCAYKMALVYKRGSLGADRPRVSARERNARPPCGWLAAARPTTSVDAS